MKIATFLTADGRETWGIVEEHRIIEAPALLEHAGLSAPADLRGFLRDGGSAPQLERLVQEGAAERAAVPRNRVRMRAPIPSPSKIVCMGLNFEDYRRILGLEYLAVPQMFLKAPSAIIGPDEPVELPVGYGAAYHEFEIAAVIGRRTRDVPRQQAWDAIFGYTILNDLVLHDVELMTREYQQWAKNVDTFAPSGPWIATPDEVPIHAARMVRRRNGRIESESSTAEMRRQFDELIAFVAAFTTLEPGDLITSASPPAGPFEAGDVIEVEVQGIGVLRNPVIARRVDEGYARELSL